MTDRVIIQLAHEVILVADHTKFGKAATGIVAPITAAHKIVTDDQIAPETLRQLRKLGITVIQA